MEPSLVTFCVNSTVPLSFWLQPASSVLNIDTLFRGVTSAQLREWYSTGEGIEKLCISAWNYIRRTRLCTRIHHRTKCNIVMLVTLCQAIQISFIIRSNLFASIYRALLGLSIVT